MFTPKAGFSLHCLGLPMNDEFFAWLPKLGIYTAELYPLFYDKEEGGKERLKAELAKNGILAASIHTPFGGIYDISKAEHHDTALAALMDCLDDAVYFGAKLVIIHASSEPIPCDKRMTRACQALLTMREAAPAYRNAGVKMAVEVLPRTCLGNNVEEVMGMVDVLGRDVAGVCLDVNHCMNMYAELPDWIRKLGDYLITTHLSDYDGVDERHWLPCKGVIDWNGVLKALADIDYQGPFNCEARSTAETTEEKVADFRESMGKLGAL